MQDVGPALLAGSITGSYEGVAMLDHIILGCDDLDWGIALVEEHTGIGAAIGGVHPGRGTRNALLSLGERQYLEIVAPDPEQSSVRQFVGISRMTVPRLVGWATRQDDLDRLAQILREARVPFDGPRPGSRARPDGRVLDWRTLDLADTCQGLLPFFIEWDPAAAHPGSDAPPGCRLQQFALVSSDPDGVSRILRRIGIDVPVECGEHAQLRARITGPKGDLEIRS